MESKEIDKEIILAWLQGNYSIAQLRILQEYLHDPAYRKSLEKFLREEWGEVKELPMPPLPDLEVQYEKFRGQLQGRGEEAEVVQRRPVRRLMRSVAAAAVVFVLLGGLWWLYRSMPAGKRLVAISQVVVSTAPGEKKTIQLLDSTVVYLGAASTLKYDAGYNGDNRRVILEGEGYFVVKHENPYPFTVVTGDLATVDIGTEFNIRHYAGEGAIEVAVASGRVEVHAVQDGKESRLAALKQGQQLEYDPVTKKSVSVDLPDTSVIGSWRKGVLIFRKRPLKEVTDELERYYGVSIRYEHAEQANILLTTLLDNRSLEEALDIVMATAGVKYAREGNRIVVR
ncbi:MAG: FecR domain-containing protein [Chitinophagaceae bacterium]|nr:FecR domain-containing protein [Chitinophagaceae bacterium]